MDFGAGRVFPPLFVENYLRLVHSAALNNFENVRAYSIDLGFLVGTENSTMIQAHVESVMKVGEPFQKAGLYDFGVSTIVEGVYNLAPTMLQHRLKPPPPEVYSLHRKLAGCYLLCIKLKAHVNAHQMFFDIYSKFDFIEDTADYSNTAESFSLENISPSSSS
ncbi:hypothetical protein IE077_002173 [Cardiosporidium cionae]|uniref:Uncharacterized protein n=1 Tax=Cardiosporidium cionae TaxID=476202 RepID=A0ABQ7J5H1_9APIC|nr:hypothetical protein IE077_002173 [Cardiosporidium cionae]|eukprot:KAF8818143.1 hypothetical protein IE077_002173 [Cardiosporidium cionae]